MSERTSQHEPMVSGGSGLGFGGWGEGGSGRWPQEEIERHRAALLVILRVAFSAVFVVMLVLSLIPAEQDPGSQMRLFGVDVKLAPDWHLKLGVGVLLAAVVVAVDVFTPRKKISTLAAVFFGLLVAMLATLAIGRLIDLLATLYSIEGPQANALLSTTKVFIGIALAYLSIVTVLQTQDDFRLVIPYVEFAKQMRGVKPLVLDSSALIDARIVEIGETEAVQAPVIIPQFVVAELQVLADSHDKMKRARGRRGLEVIGRLQRSAALDVSIDETPVPGKAVDQMLVELGKMMPAVIVTTDLGLARVARIQGVHALNLNDLANAMKPSFVPGEELRLKLIKPGEQQGQAVGYLEDGTMVVAENGVDRIGEQADLVVTSSLQTSAGRMIFARIADDSSPVGEPSTGSDEPEGESTQPTRSEGARGSDRSSSAESRHGTPSGSDRGTATPGPAAGPRSPSRSKGRNPRR